MTVLAGFFALIHTLVLPGYIISRFLKDYKSNAVLSTVQVISFSLLFNYLLNYCLATVGLYTANVIWALICLEILAVILGGVLKSRKIKAGSLKEYLKRMYVKDGPVFFLLYLISVAVIVLYLLKAVESFGDVFRYWDAVVSWNRWAVEWAGNQVPSMTGHYAQLIPANLSIAYLLIGDSSIQFFSRAVMIVFPLMSLLLFLGMGIKKRNYYYLISLLLYHLILRYFYKFDFIFEGYVDIAVAFFALLTFLIIHSGEKELSVSRVLKVFSFASAATVTKQAGLYILIYSIVWLIYRIITGRKELKGRVIKLSATALLVILTVSGSWYIVKEIQIKQGKEYSEVQVVTQNIHGGRDMVERFKHGLYVLTEKPHCEFSDEAGEYSRAGLGAIAVFALLGLFYRRSRNPLIFIGIPFYLLWSFYFSYDFRNLTLAFPFIALAAGGGLYFITGKLIKYSRSGLQIYPGRIVLTLVVVAAVMGNTVFRKEILKADQIDKQRKIGKVSYNKRLFQYKRVFGLKGRILTGYQYLASVPGFRNYTNKAAWLLRSEDFQNLADGRGDFKYIFNHKGLIRSEGMRTMRKLVAEGKLVLLFEHADTVFVRRAERWEQRLNLLLNRYLNFHVLSSRVVMGASGERGGYLRLTGQDRWGIEAPVTENDVKQLVEKSGRIKGLLSFRAGMTPEAVKLVDELIKRGTMVKLFEIHGCIMVKVKND